MSSKSYTESWLEGSQFTQFYTRTYTPSTTPRAAIVFIHGFIEHIARYEHVHSAFAAAGIIVFAYDQRGFGRTALDAAHKSKSSVYGRTSWPAQLADIDWAVGHVTTQPAVKGLPVILMGHSMGGALVLGYATRSSPLKGVSSLSGVIATSPFLQQAQPASRPLRWILSKLSILTPTLAFPAGVDAEVGNVLLGLDNDDPFVKQFASLECLRGMLNGGDQLVQKDYKNWPSDLPVLLIHGTDDHVTSFKVTEAFFGHLIVTDKTFTPYENGYHELQNEPDGVKEKLTQECIAWVEQHLPNVDLATAKL